MTETSSTSQSIGQGIALRLFAAFLFTGMSAMVHGVAKDVPVGQIIFWRATVALIPTIAYMLWLGQFPSGLATKHPKMHVKRSLFGAGSMILAFTSLGYLPVANAQALAFLSPILMLPLAAIALGERLTSRILVAVSLGFAGVLIMLWEAFGAIGDDALIGGLAGLGFATSVAYVRVHIKVMTRTEKSATIAFYFSLTAAVVGLLSWPLGWVSLTGSMMLWLIGAGLFGGIAHIASTEATARAPIAVLAPFDFTGMIWAVGFDVLIFRNAPGWGGIIGVMVITFAALLVTFPAKIQSKS